MDLNKFPSENELKITLRFAGRYQLLKLMNLMVRLSLQGLGFLSFLQVDAKESK